MAHHEPAGPHAAQTHAAHDHVLHGTADDEYAFTPEGSSYEHTDANVWVIAKFGIWLAITAVIVHFGIGGVWLWMFLTELRKRPLFAVGDPYLRESLASGGGGH